MRRCIFLFLFALTISSCSVFPALAPEPSLPPLATTITPLPSNTSTPIRLPATWTPAPSETPQPTKERLTSTPFYTATIPVSKIQTIVAKPLPNIGGGVYSGGRHLSITDAKCQVKTPGLVDITGTIKNDGSVTATIVELRGTIFDKNGNVINNNTGYAQSAKIFPGTTSTFWIIVFDPNEQFASCKLDWEDVYFE